MRLSYSKCRPEHRSPGDIDDVDEFFEEAREAWRIAGKALVLQLQPGDGTRYLCALLRSTDADGEPGLIFCAWIPTQIATELTLAGYCPDVWDEPFAGLNPYTAAVFRDVLAAIVWNLPERRYDWTNARPVQE